MNCTFIQCTGHHITQLKECRAYAIVGAHLHNGSCLCVLGGVTSCLSKPKGFSHHHPRNWTRVNLICTLPCRESSLPYHEFRRWNRWTKTLLLRAFPTESNSMLLASDLSVPPNKEPSLAANVTKLTLSISFRQRPRALYELSARFPHPAINASIPNITPIRTATGVVLSALAQQDKLRALGCRAAKFSYWKKCVIKSGEEPLYWLKQGRASRARTLPCLWQTQPSIANF